MRMYLITGSSNDSMQGWQRPGPTHSFKSNIRVSLLFGINLCINMF